MMRERGADLAWEAPTLIGIACHGRGATVLDAHLTWRNDCRTMSLTSRSPPFIEQKTATAVAYVTPGKGLIRLNGSPISIVEP